MAASPAWRARTLVPADIGRDARALLAQHPQAAHLFLVHLAQDLGADARPSDLLGVLVEHRPLVERASEHAATHADADLHGLRRCLRGRAPWQSTQAIFEAVCSARRVRDLERSQCRHDARTAPSSLPLLTPAGANPVSNGACHLRLHNPHHIALAGMLLGSQMAPPSVASITDHEALIPAAPGYAGHSALRLLGRYPLLAATGAALTVSGTTVLLAWSCWPQASPLPPTVPPREATDTSQQALCYLDQQLGIDGEPLLDTLLWSAAGNSGQHDAPLQALTTLELTDLQALAGNGTALGPWLAALVELDDDPADARAIAPATHLRSIRSVDQVRSAAAPRSVQIAACRAISPRSQTLVAVEQGVVALTASATLQAVPAADLSVFARCLHALRNELHDIGHTLALNSARLREGISVLPEIDILRAQHLNGLIQRTNALESLLHNAQIQLNQHIVDAAD